MLADKLKQLRHDAGLTQTELAEKLETNQRTYCSWENGTREPNIQMLIKIAQFYKTSVDYLIGRY